MFSAVLLIYVNNHCSFLSLTTVQIIVLLLVDLQYFLKIKTVCNKGEIDNHFRCQTGLATSASDIKRTLAKRKRKPAYILPKLLQQPKICQLVILLHQVNKVDSMY